MYSVLMYKAGVWQRKTKIWKDSAIKWHSQWIKAFVVSHRNL